MGAVLGIRPHPIYRQDRWVIKRMCDGFYYFEADEPNIIGIHKGIEGSAIVQGGKIAAVVRRANGKYLECVSAELVAVDLFRMMYEQSFTEEA